MEGLLSTPSSFALISKVTCSKLVYPIPKSANLYILFVLGTTYVISKIYEFFVAVGKWRLFCRGILRMLMLCLWVFFLKFQQTPKYTLLYYFLYSFLDFFACENNIKKGKQKFCPRLSPFGMQRHFKIMKIIFFVSKMLYSSVVVLEY